MLLKSAKKLLVAILLGGKTLFFIKALNCNVLVTIALTAAQNAIWQSVGPKVSLFNNHLVYSQFKTVG